MDLWSSIQLFLELSSGLLQAPDGGRDNLVLYTAYLIREFEDRKEWDKVKLLQDRVVSYFINNEVALGLSRRYPGGDNSIDNVIGAIYVSDMLTGRIGQRWVSFAACFNCDNPAWVGIGRYWFGRFLGTKHFIDVRAKVDTTIINKFFWTLSSLFSIFFSKGASNLLLLSLQMDVMKKQGKHKWLVALFYNKYKLSSLYEEYFGKEFPITVSRKEIERV